jgi:aminoglycoside phosphotransferase family enzyme/predicted kinase
MTAVAGRQAEVLAALRDPRTYGASGRVEHRETHISHVFLVEDRAYKLKKELTLPFLDYGTLEQRHVFCREEVRLNRFFAPTVYVGVRAVVRTPDGFALLPDGDPTAVEYLVEMRRFNESDTLDALVRDGRADGALLHRVGESIARSHARATPAQNQSGADLQRKRLEADLAQLEGACAEDETRSEARAARAFVARSALELDARAERGLVREGHGDLRLEHILVRDVVELVDCVEFDPELRLADVAYDLAFAVMELHERELPEAAHELAAAYRAGGGHPGDDELLAGFAACRAIVRAKVAALRSPRRPGELDRFLRVARRLFWLARGRLTVLVCGPAGVGKTTLATELARASGLPHLSSDVVRKAQAGLPPTAPLGASGYTDDASHSTYDELGRRARALGARGGSIVDATFRRESDRAAFEAAFADAPGAYLVLRLDLRPELARDRAAHRTAGPAQPSDAGPEQALTQAAAFEPLAGAWLRRSVTLDAAVSAHDLAESAEAAIDRVLASPPG